MRTLIRFLALLVFLLGAAGAQAGGSLYYKLKITGALSYEIADPVTTTRIKTVPLSNGKLAQLFGLAPADYQLVLDFGTSELLFLAKSPSATPPLKVVCRFATDFNLLTGDPMAAGKLSVKGFADVNGDPDAIGTFFQGADGRGTLTYRVRAANAGTPVFDSYVLNLVIRATNPAPETGSANAIITLKGVLGARVNP